MTFLSIFSSIVVLVLLLYFALSFLMKKLQLHKWFMPSPKQQKKGKKKRKRKNKYAHDGGSSDSIWDFFSFSDSGGDSGGGDGGDGGGGGD